MKSIVFCGSGTAGHVMPNLAIMDELLTKENYKLYYIGTGGMERKIIAPYLTKNVGYYEFKGAKFKRKLSPELIILPIRVMSSVNECKKILRLIRPSLVVSKGGFGGYPVVKAAAALHIPAIAQESDYNLGLGNKMSLKYVRKMFTVFPDAAKQAGKKGVHCSAPLRKQIINGNKDKGYKICGFDSQKPILLLIGGSLGSIKLNEIMKKSLPILTEKFYVIAITGKNKKIDFSNESFFQLEFTNKIGDLYAISDIAVSRGGSNTLSEFSAIGLPPLIIPLEKGSRGEQKKNAMYYEKNNAAVVLRESEIDENSFINAVYDVYKRKNELSDNIKKLYQRDNIMLDYILSY